MKRTIWFGLLAFTALACLLNNTSSFTQAGDKAKDKKIVPAKGAATPYVHTVIFYVKKDAPKGTLKGMIDDAPTLLGKIPTVKGLRIGPPAAKHTPKVAVTDYDLGLLVLFENYEGLKTYLEHPLHLEYVNRYEKHLDKVLVYDFAQGK